MQDELPAYKTEILPCGHRMCHKCLKRQFTLSVNDIQHMPPRCCSKEPIPPRFVDRLFDDKFKRLWNLKYEEYSATQELCCPAKGCGNRINSSRIKVDFAPGKTYARCGRCSTKICGHCSNRYHQNPCVDSPRTVAKSRLFLVTDEKGSQRCYNCKAAVSGQDGCNHITW